MTSVMRYDGDDHGYSSNIGNDNRSGCSDGGNALEEREDEYSKLMTIASSDIQNVKYSE